MGEQTAAIISESEDSQAWNYSGFARMYERLVIYGLCYLRSGEGRHRKIIEWQDWARDRYIKRVWTGSEIEDAARLHSRIIRLPLRHNLVLQVFFGEACAADWAKLKPELQEEIIHDLTYWSGGPPGVNARIRNANKEWGWNVPTINEFDFLLIRDRAIRMLCNSETLLHVAQSA